MREHNLPRIRKKVELYIIHLFITTTTSNDEESIAIIVTVLVRL